ncbi:MAG: PilZ domain-containing protein [Sphingorhabdus sp.]
MIDPQNKMDENADSAAKRDADRDSLFLKAILRFPASKEEGEVRIRNLSAGGLMAEAPVQVTRGEKVELKLRNIGWVSGTVAWITEGRIGIAFEQPIDPKTARKPVGQTKSDVPFYLTKLDRQQDESKRNLRRL